MPPKNGPRGKRSSSKARARREEQLDLFPQDHRLVPTTRPFRDARRAAPRNETGQKRVDSGVLTQLGLH
ncbi:MAG TPA: hypothetical protein VE907_22835 [Gammaproteobacteria bacterium]|nr:hypothetical protein [Gammaproteobacteria bacterium]